MSYVNAREAGQNKVVTAAVVAVIQTGVVLALMNGFKVNFFPEPAPPRVEGQQIKLPPVPPPPTDDPKPHKDTRTTNDSPPVTKAPTDPDVHKVPDNPPMPTGGPTTGEATKPYEPVDPPPRPPSFAPKSAKAQNDPATWVTTSDFPGRDLHEGHQGRVGFELRIGVNGRAESCRIIASSGFPGLDAATCTNVIKRARFEAATDDTGAKAPGAYSGTIRWVIPRD